MFAVVKLAHIIFRITGHNLAGSIRDTHAGQIKIFTGFLQNFLVGGNIRLQLQHQGKAPGFSHQVVVKHYL